MSKIEKVIREKSNNNSQNPTSPTTQDSWGVGGRDSFLSPGDLPRSLGKTAKAFQDAGVSLGAWLYPRGEDHSE